MANPQLDIIKELEESMEASSFIPYSPQAMQRYVEMSQKSMQSGEDFNPLKMQLVHDQHLRYASMALPSPYHARVYHEKFDAQRWPIIQKSINRLHGQGQFMLEHGCFSFAVPTFMYDSATQQEARALLLAHCITHDFDGNLKTIDPTRDSMLTFCQSDSSLAFVRFRADKMQKEIAQSKKILVPGGGASAMLWTRGFEPSANGRQIVIYDKQDMRRDLEQLLGKSLSAAHIDYRIGDFREAFTDPEQQNQYDLIVPSGVMSYYSDNLGEILKGFANLLQPSGQIVYDLQIMHPNLMFDVLVIGWTSSLKPEKTAEVAKEKSKKAMQEANLIYVKDEAQVWQGTENVVLFWAQKPY